MRRSRIKIELPRDFSYEISADIARAIKKSARESAILIFTNDRHPKRGRNRGRCNVPRGGTEETLRSASRGTIIPCRRDDIDCARTVR